MITWADSDSALEQPDDKGRSHSPGSGTHYMWKPVSVFD